MLRKRGSHGRPLNKNMIGANFWIDFTIENFILPSHRIDQIILILATIN